MKSRNYMHGKIPGYKVNDLLEKYRSKFPKSEIDALFDYQKKAIEQIVAGINTLCIIPTGGGKPLIYQLAGLELGGVTIVISPLKALMQEQVDYLTDKKIPALALTSDIKFQRQRDILRKLSTSEIKFLYLSPERLQNYFFRAALIKSGKEIKQIIIDEAHCISQWGFDFRPEYSDIISFQKFLHRNNLKPVICALTATLSSRAINDIKSEYLIDSPIIYSRNGVIREELKLSFSKVGDFKNETEKWGRVLDFLALNKSKKAVIYLYSKNKCEKLSARFNKEKPIINRVADFFHADEDETVKTDKRKKFRNGQINYLFSTTAFGMGMNIPDIDCIIQYHVPKSIEEYYQQVGRGARNIIICPECNCLLLWSESNIRANKREIEKESTDLHKTNRAIEQLNLSEKHKGGIASISFSELQNAKINLKKYKFYFEKLKIIKSIGEINGGPKSIRFINDTPKWIKIKKAAIANSFILASIALKENIQDLINYVFDQDLLHNVEYLPAMEKKVFLEKMVDEINENVKEQIINDINLKVKYQLDRFELLEKLCKAEFPNEFLKDIFQKNEKVAETI